VTESAVTSLQRKGIGSGLWEFFEDPSISTTSSFTPSRPKSSLEVLLLIVLGAEPERQASLDVAVLGSQAERKRSERKVGCGGREEPR
jgi:hypothetical protein